ncbi:hypothetical protein KQI68_10135 [Peptoniphilus sp. MSJ-1]|uniref:Uncharacterized protein n=1 Tax=Peptoniphilus ovalis TaxID=2841503 RepID=A0ABS6FJF7_9FIRM|nr:hypothetical protein [Peptoniphilus ovalis]MBU5670188.1 hypothetical protein [Peptoniphilus ovalis]
MFYLMDAEEIYNQRTKNYFQEVLKNYSNQCYRSALVSLYSVTICDIIYKLEELSEDYNDASAKKILSEIDKERNSGNLSQWESKLISTIYDRKRIIDNETKAFIDSLKQFRNLSAHPSLNDNFDLYEPDKDTTIALIKNILNGILIKAPLISSNIMDKLTNDLKENKNWLLINEVDLKNFLVEKYYSRMDSTTVKYVFKNLWKFCYVSDSYECIQNVDINIAALKCLLNYKYDEIISYLEEEKILNQIGVEDNYKLNLCKLLFVFPKLYTLLDESLKKNIDAFIDSNKDAKIFASFKNNDKHEHLLNLKNTEFNFPSEDEIKTLYRYYEDDGFANELLDFFIECFRSSSSFDEADLLFDNIINPFLQNYNITQIKEIIKAINTNSQLHARRRSYYDNTALISELIIRSDYNEIDFLQYRNFKYNNSIKPKEDELPFSLNEDELPFTY